MGKAGKTRHPKTRLMCRVCSKHGRHAFNLRVTRERQELMIDGKEITHAAVECKTKQCGHKWWSRHPEAVRLSRKLDGEVLAEANT